MMTTDGALTSPSTLVVVGNGMVGQRFCARLTASPDAHRFRIIVLGEERWPAYDRVGLTGYFKAAGADELLLEDAGWYARQGIDLRLGTRAESIDREARTVTTSAGKVVGYDHLVLATGSEPFVPPLPGLERDGVFLYRTLDDLDRIRAWAAGKRRALVLGGGLLGLEAARAVQELGLETHVVEIAPRLMPRQLDERGAVFLESRIRKMDLHLHLGRGLRAVRGSPQLEAVEFTDGSRMEVDLLIVSAGIRPRDELARAAGLATAARGGVIVDDCLRTSDPHIFAIGEVASHRQVTYGLVAPGYEMATVLARNLLGETATFEGTDQSAKLKLMGVDVASFGDPFAETERTSTVSFEDHRKGIYKKLLISECGRKLLGGMLVGDASQYAELLHLTRSGGEIPEAPEELLFGVRRQGGPNELPDAMQVCSCNNITKGAICQSIRAGGLKSVGDVKSATDAGTGCGGCLPMVTDLLHAELARAGHAVRTNLCEHFDHTRQELFEIVSVTGLATFEEILARYGRGLGCEVCKPTIASILASTRNRMILEQPTIQDTNDRFLANIQRQGLYSVVPRIPGGEITPEKLIVIGEVAKKYGLYTKITGGQRVDLFGARVDQLPEIWEELVAAGFESGHAYGKALRTVKSCVGSTWCRFGVQDSVGFAVRVENRYKGLRAPHKMKSAVSGCVRECAEAQSKDFGIIATEKGWNLYVCGNGGAKPRHAELLAADLDEETCLRYIDRFLMYYIRTADRLTRTSVWLEKLDGGIEHVRDVVVRDSLGLGAELERQMQELVDGYACEWAAVVNDAEKRAAFRHFANTDLPDDHVTLQDERGQVRPADWPKAADIVPLRLPERRSEWVKVARADAVPLNGGIAVQHGEMQLAVFHHAAEGRWYATQNQCPHKGDMVLARGLLGDQQGEPKVACPLHKKTFSLQSGLCLSGDVPAIQTFPIRLEDGWLHVELPVGGAPQQAGCGQTCPHESLPRRRATV